MKLNNYSEVIEAYINTEVTIKELSKVFQLSAVCISNILHKNNIPVRRHRKYNINKDYFKVINTPEKAYILGFIYADGCVYKEVLTIALASKDKELLELIKNQISPNYKIKHTNSTYSILGNKPKVYYKSSFRLCSKDIVNDLYALGCYPKKSLTLQFPSLQQVPFYLLPNFIHGYFDGDGSVTKNDHHVSFLGSFDFLNKLQEYLFEYHNVPKTKISLDKKESNIYKLSLGGINKIKTFYSLFYQGNNSSIYLKRKKDIFCNHLINYKQLPTGYFYLKTDIGKIKVDSLNNYSLTDAWRLLGKPNSKTPGAYLRYARFYNLISKLKIDKQNSYYLKTKDIYSCKDVFQDYVNYLQPTQQITYKVTNPEGEEIITTDLNYFYELYKIPPKDLRRVAAGTRKQHKGWKCSII